MQRIDWRDIIVIIIIIIIIIIGGVIIIFIPRPIPEPDCWVCGRGPTLTGLAILLLGVKALIDEFRVKPAVKEEIDRQKLDRG